MRVLFLFLLILSGCSDPMAKMVGKTPDDLLVNYGPPTNVLPVGERGAIFIYSQEKQRHNQGYVPSGQTQATGDGALIAAAVDGFLKGANPPTTTIRMTHRMFWINDEGYIYKWAKVKN